MPQARQRDGRRVATVVVRNSVDHDSRVLRVAGALRGLGMETSVLGVVSFTQTSQVTEHDGIPVRRIGPGSLLGWRVYREISSLRPNRAAATAPSAGRPAPGPAATLAGRVRRPARRALRSLSTLAYYLRATRALSRLAPDLVHCCDYNTMWVGLAARAMHGSAVIYDSHEIWPDRSGRTESRAWLMLCEALFVRVADRVVVTSPGHAEVIARRYGVPLPVTVRNVPQRPERSSGQAADRAAGGEAEAAGGEAENGAGERIEARGGATAVYAGGLQAGRGIEEAIRALALAPKVRLRLLGPGAPEYRTELEDLVRSLAVSDRVEFADPVPPSELLGALADADAGLALFQPTCLSHRLVLPNKLFEYTVAGLPVIASDVPMIARFVREHGSGAVVEASNVTAIARALQEVLDPERNAGYRQAARRAAATLDWDDERRLLDEVYRSALARRGRHLAAS